jgi:hypothetical protein
MQLMEDLNQRFKFSENLFKDYQQIQTSEECVRVSLTVITDSQSSQ